MKKSLLLCLLALASVGCTNSSNGSHEPMAAAPVKAQQIYRHVDKFVDHDLNVVCYIKRSTYYRQSDSIACVNYME